MESGTKAICRIAAIGTAFPVLYVALMILHDFIDASVVREFLNKYFLFEETFDAVIVIGAVACVASIWAYFSCRKLRYLGYAVLSGGISFFLYTLMKAVLEGGI